VKIRFKHNSFPNVLEILQNFWSWQSCQSENPIWKAFLIVCSPLSNLIARSSRVLK